jgi:hypothetical protein
LYWYLIYRLHFSLTDLVWRVVRVFAAALRAVVALLTELVSLIAQADSDSDGCDGRTDSGGDDEAEGANPSTIIRVLVTAVDVLHRYCMGGSSATSFVERCCLDEEAAYARIYSCVVALSGDVRPGYNGLLLSPDLPGFAHQRLQQVSLLHPVYQWGAVYFLIYSLTRLLIFVRIMYMNCMV